MADDPQQRPGQHARRTLAPGEIDPGGRERRGDHPAANDAVAVKPRRQGLLVIGQYQWVLPRRRLRIDLTAQRVERGELPGRDLVIGEAAEGREQRLAFGLERVDGPAGGGWRRLPGC